MPLKWRECYRTKQQGDSAKGRDTFGTEVTFCFSTLSPLGYVLTSVSVSTPQWGGGEALLDRLSLKVVELGERNEDKDSVPNLDFS